MRTSHLVRLLGRLHACDEALTWLQQLDDMPVHRVWQKCERIDWMWWLLEELDSGGATNKLFDVMYPQGSKDRAKLETMYRDTRDMTSLCYVSTDDLIVLSMSNNTGVGSVSKLRGAVDWKHVKELLLIEYEFEFMEKPK